MNIKIKCRFFAKKSQMTGFIKAQLFFLIIMQRLTCHVSVIRTTNELITFLYIIYQNNHIYITTLETVHTSQSV